MDDSKIKISTSSLDYRIHLPMFDDEYWWKYKMNGLSIIEVNPSSPLKLRRAIEKCARYFKMEKRYDFVQYDAKYSESNQTAYLFVKNVGRNMNQVIGAACFITDRKYVDMENFVLLQWIWVHPFDRGRGILSEELLEMWNEKFGYWYPEPPLSKAMIGFVKKHKLESPLQRFNIKHDGKTIFDI